MGKEKVREAWQDYWVLNRDREVVLDEMSAAILSEILKNAGNLSGKKVLEAGCGRGVISAKLTELGADLSLLDISPEALEIARKHFAEKNLKASFVHGDILDMPFGEGTFDMVWNAGVMEHFEGDLQTEALRAISHIIRPGGLFISCNPYAGAVFYSLGKRSAERKGRWPYGPEFPVKSLKEPCRSSGLAVTMEYPICFRENLSYLSYVSKHLRSVVKFLLRPFPKRLLIRLFGGYLLVTVARKDNR